MNQQEPDKEMKEMISVHWQKQREQIGYSVENHFFLKESSEEAHEAVSTLTDFATHCTVAELMVLPIDTRKSELEPGT